MKRKVYCYLLAVVMLVSVLAGCSGASETDEPEAKPTEEAGDSEEAEGAAADKQEYEVYYIAKQLSDPFCNWCTSVIENEFTANYPNIHLTTFDGELSVETRTKLMEDVMVKKPDMLILQYFDEAEVGIIQEVIDAGIPVVVTNGHYTSVDVDSFCSFVDIDPYAQGAVVASAAAERLPENAKVVLILGVAGNQHSENRKNAWNDYLLKERPDIELLAEANADWDKDKAMALMEDWIQAFPEIDGVITCYDSMALGAMEALKDANRLEGVQIYGTDALPDACLAIEAGEYTATVLQDGYAIGTGAVQVVVDVLINGNDEIQQIYTETPLIDATNVEDMLETHRASGMLVE